MRVVQLGTSQINLQKQDHIIRREIHQDPRDFNAIERICYNSFNHVEFEPQFNIYRTFTVQVKTFFSTVFKAQCSENCGIFGVPGVLGVPRAAGQDGLKGDVASIGEKGVRGNPGSPLKN